MRARFGLVVVIAAVWAGCQCGASSPCDGVKCISPLICEPGTGRCINGSGGGAAGGGGSSAGGGQGGTGGGTPTDGGAGGGGGMAVCTPACTGTMVCHSASNTCRICTATAGCSGAEPVCDPAGNGGQGRCVACTTTSCTAPRPFCDQAVLPSGACVGCRSFADCPTFGTTCDLATHTCVPEDGGGSGSGGGAGAGGGSGAGGGTGNTVLFDDAGMTARCLPFDAGTKACTSECPRGFFCVNGLCELRGSGGPVQVTLRFPVSEDLDLHVHEPVTDGGSCEIWYGNPNFDAGPPPFPVPFPIPMPRPCGALGWLDLDSNAACNLDHVNVENVIYPASKPATLGTYRVNVDYYQNCSATSPVPYEVEVRAGGTARYYCGSFTPSMADMGSANSGRFITQFTLQ